MLVKIIVITIGYFIAFALPILLIAIFHKAERGTRLYNKGRAYFGSDGQFHLTKKGQGKAKFAWLPHYDEYGWVWFDPYWKND